MYSHDRFLNFVIGLNDELMINIEWNHVHRIMYAKNVWLNVVIVSFVQSVGIDCQDNLEQIIQLLNNNQNQKQSMIMVYNVYHYDNHEWPFQIQNDYPTKVIELLAINYAML